MAEPSRLREFILILDVGRFRWTSGLQSPLCPFCRTDIISHQRAIIPSAASPEWPFADRIDVRSPAPVPLCDECHKTCRMLYEDACRRTEAAVAQLELARCHIAAQRLTVCLQGTAQRIAFLRALPHIRAHDDVAGRPPMVVGFRSTCIWCRQPADSHESVVAMAGAGVTSPGHETILLLHPECWKEVEGINRRGLAAVCARLPIYQLPLLPEVCRLIAAFVCQLPGVDGEAAAVFCPLLVL